MSTLPGLASKGEKGKSKYQSLDINNLYKVYTTEPLETQQQKNTLPRKHGMQSLGKVPTARRPPANLPSLKSEHTGSDSAVSLVPSGGAGWGKQEPNSSTSTTPPTSTSTVTVTNATNSNLASTPASVQPVNVLPSVPSVPQSNKNHIAPIVTAVTGDKSWSAVMSGTDLLQPPPYQSPQFQHEFPSLSAGDGGPVRTGSDTQYGPGPSLRPQTEGSWIQGGSRPGVEAPPPRSSSAPLGPPPQLTAPVGQPQQNLPPQYRSLIPPFMCRGNFPPNGHGGSNFANVPPAAGSNSNGGRIRGAGQTKETDEVGHRPIIKEEELNRMDDMTRDVGWASHDDIDYNQKLAFSDDELEQRKRNKQNSLQQQQQQQQQQQLQQQPQQKSFDKSDQDGHSKNWSNKPVVNSQQPMAQSGRNRSNEEDEVWVQRRRMHSEEVAQVIERAKQRKEEEEKRFLKSRQGAAKKLQQLEEKISKSKQDKEVDDSQGTINPLVVPPQPIQPVPIPVPEWERDKDGGARLPIESSNNNCKQPPQQHRESSLDFRKLSQIEGRNFIRKETRSSDRDSKERERTTDSREPNGPSFSKKFQTNLPPRFQKQQQMRNASSTPSSQINTSFSDQYDIRWQQGQNKNTSGIRKIRQENDDLDNKVQDDQERKDGKKFGNDDYRSSVQDSLTYDENHDVDYRREENWDKDNKSEKHDLFNEHINSNSSCEDRHDKYEDKVQDRFERPQRPDSRDSRASRDSRHSRESVRDLDIREYNGSWADTAFEQSYDERRKEHMKDDRRTVPGPITRDRIEAEDFKSEKKNLIQLKRGYISEKKNLDIKKEDREASDKIKEADWNETIKTEDRNNETLGSIKVWADNIPSNNVLENMAVLEPEINNLPHEGNDNQEIIDDNKIEKDLDEKEEKRKNSNRRCIDPPRQQQQGWGNAASGSYVYRSSWSKKNEPKRSVRPGAPPPKKPSNKTRDWHGFDSDVSVDEPCACIENGKDDRPPHSLSKNIKKYEKDDKNKETKMENLKHNGDRKSESTRRDNYVPRGEPSRHGRGGGNFRSRGGLCNRVERFDVYGPPSSKSPFSQHEEKDKKCSDENGLDNVSSDEKTKQNQQVLSAGIDGCMNKSEASYLKKNDDNKIRSLHLHQKKSKNDETLNVDHCDTSDNSEENSLKDCKTSPRFTSKNSTSAIGASRSNVANTSRRLNPPPRFTTDKRNSYTMRHENSNIRPNYSGSIKKEAIKMEDDKSVDLPQVLEKSCKVKETIENDQIDIAVEENLGTCDADGFQEVKSKKTGQRQKSFDEKPIIKPVSKLEKDQKVVDRKRPSVSTAQLTPQQIANIPSLMDTPINPPVIVQQLSNKSQFDRTRQSKLPPRLAKQRENHRLQKVQMQQQGICDVSDINQVGHNMNIYGLKEGAAAMSGRITNAWEKPLGSHLRTEPETVLNVGIESTKNLDQSQQPANGSNIDKTIKSNQLSEKTVLDGATAPVNTIIFENTNFKSAPGARPTRTDKSCNKLEDGGIEQVVISGFNKPMRDLLNKNDKQAESIQMQLNFNKEDSADMKLDFFESELSHLTDDKSSKNIALPRSMHAITSTNSNTTTADALNFKIASVKKVWESMPTVMEHSVGQDDSSTSFSTSFGPDPNSLDPSGAFSKGGDAPDDTHEVYSASPNLQPTSNNTTNVCKVKPTQQVAGTTGQAVHATAHQQHSAVVGPGIVGHPLSPPPLQPVIGAGVGLGQPPQPYSSNQHLSYQPNLGGSTQYGMSAIPSPPTVLFNSQAAQTGLYGAFQIDQSVLGGQARSQYSQYANPYGLGQTASSPYSGPSVYLQGTQPHPPTPQAPPDLYQNINSYRLTGTGHFGQSQQLNNPTTVLISSTSNSLMSATVKPSTQQISAIGTKANGAGQAYQQSQQGQQLYMAYDPSMQANYTGVMQRGPTAPLQNSVVPGLQPSSSYYTGSTGGQTGFFQQPGNSTIPSAPLQQHQAGYGLQGNVFGNPNQSHTTAGLQNFSFHSLSSPMQIAAALNAQQYRSSNLQNTPYVKSLSNHAGDPSSRPQQIKSPGSQQDVLSSVFNSGPQISSPKSRPNMKQPPPQPSPTQQHKYNLYQSVGNQPSSQTQRYPTPIQRPVTFQPAVGALQTNSGGSNSKHRTTNQTNKLAARNYYGTQGGNLTTNTQNDKVEDGKLNDNSNSAIINNSANIVNKAVSGNSNTITNQAAEVAKDTAKEDGSVIKE